jgi:hypothetical protein
VTTSAESGADLSEIETLSSWFEVAGFSNDAMINHAYSEFLKQYLNLVGGFSFNESSFNLFKNSSTPGAQAGGGISPYTVLDFESFGFENAVMCEDPDSLMSYRDDIIKILHHGIEHSIIGDFDASTESADRIVAKVIQSYLFSPEKYANRVLLPKLFERIFCIVIDHDQFVKSGWEDDVSDMDIEEEILASYKSELFNIYVTAEITWVGDAIGYTLFEGVEDFELTELTS